MPTSPAPVRFGVIGVNHNHIFEMTELLRHAGAGLVGFYALEDDLAAAYVQRVPDARRLRSEAEILEDPAGGVNAVHTAITMHAPVGGRSGRADVGGTGPAVAGVEPAVRSPGEAIEQFMPILQAKAALQHCAPVSFAIPIGVFQE